MMVKKSTHIRVRYERNSGLDLDGDGFISVGELGSRIKNKMSDFGIEDLTLPEEDLSSITYHQSVILVVIQNQSSHLLIIQVMKLMN